MYGQSTNNPQALPTTIERERVEPESQRVMPILARRVDGRLPRLPAITSPTGALLGLENWKRSTRWKEAIDTIGRPSLRVHDLRHTYASLARRAGADLRLLQKTLGHASITVTAHIYADLYDDELDDVASALDALDDTRPDPPKALCSEFDLSRSRQHAQSPPRFAAGACCPPNGGFAQIPSELPHSNDAAAIASSRANRRWW